ncbi:MAG: FISUMP domain-containing protein [Bacteroidales bacterium]
MKISIKIKSVIGIAIKTKWFVIIVLLILSSCKQQELVNVTKSNLNKAVYLNDSTLQIEMEIIELGNAIHFGYGICYSSDNSKPTISDNKIQMGNIENPAIMNLVIENISSSQKYYLRGFIMNDNLPVYSINILSTPDLQSVKTDNVTAINSVSASLTATITVKNLPADAAFEYGLTSSYGQSGNVPQNPLSENSDQNVNLHIVGLNPDTEYHCRVVATSDAGTNYGEDKSFRTLKKEVSTVSDVDGNVYNTIVIGSQEWMVEDLKTTKYNNGTSLTCIEDNQLWGTNTNGAYCWFEDLPVQNKKYGISYNWYVVDSLSNGNRNICPVGWHVPSEQEFDELITFLGGYENAGAKLKEVGTANWSNPNLGADNSSGFSAIPHFFVVPEGLYAYSGESCTIWTRSKALNDRAYAVTFRNTENKVNIDALMKNSGYSMRCLKDK